MDPQTDSRTDVFCFDQARPPLALVEPPPPPPPPGFYRSETTDFYVTADGRVYLLRTPGEPACLHQCHALPSTAVRSSARVDPPLEILARAADELARPTTGRMRSIRDEVRRDRLVAVGALLQETLACVSEDGARLVVDVEGVTGCGLRLADGTCLAEQVPGDRSGSWVREGTAAAAALAAIDAAPAGPRAVRYVRRLPTVAAARVVAGEIPAGTFSGRVVVVGRADAAAAGVATPLGAMSPAQVLAQALLGVLDEAAPRGLPGWTRALLLCAWAAASALLLRRRGGRALAGMMLAALVLDAGLYVGGIAAGLAGPCMVATLVVGVIEVGLRVARRVASPVREAEPAASGLHARPSGPDQVTGA